MGYLTDNRTTPGCSNLFNSVQPWIVAIDQSHHMVAHFMPKSTRRRSGQNLTMVCLKRKGFGQLFLHEQENKKMAGKESDSFDLGLV